MQKDVLISLKGFNGKEKQLEFITLGKYYKKGEYYYVTYDGTKMIGMEGTTTTLKVENNKVSLIREGLVNSNFIFEEGKENEALYETQYGVFTVSIKASKLLIDISDKGGVIEMDYLLNFADGNNSSNRFHMTIKEVANNNEYSQ